MNTYQVTPSDDPSGEPLEFRDLEDILDFDMLSEDEIKSIKELAPGGIVTLPATEFDEEMTITRLT